MKFFVCQLKNGIWWSTSNIALQINFKRCSMYILVNLLITKFYLCFSLISISFSWAHTHTHTHTHTRVHAYNLLSLHAAKSGLLCWGKRQKAVHCHFNIYLRYFIFMGFFIHSHGGIADARLMCRYATCCL